MGTFSQRLQQRLLKLRSNKIFEIVVITIIILSALVLGAKTYDMDPRFIKILGWFDQAVTVFFVLELSVRMLAEERFKNFFKQGWNIFDFIIVTVSLIPLDESEMALLARLLRIFRVLRLVAIIPELRMLISALVIAIPRMGYVALLMFIIFYIYAAFGSILFEEINPTLWGDIAIAMLTLFRVATFEDWTDVMYETMDVYPLSWIFYLSFIFLTAFVFLNMMIGIVINVMQEEHEKNSIEEGKGEAGEVHWIKEHTQEIENRLIRIESSIQALSKARTE